VERAALILATPLAATMHNSSHARDRENRR